MIAFALLKDKPEVDVSAHLDIATTVGFWGIGLVLAFFLVRPELWRRLFFTKVDPRPAALMRMFFGFVVLWTFTDLLMPHGALDTSAVRYLFTDEGLWLTDYARKSYGGNLRELWDPEHGFEHWYDLFKAMWGKFSVLHFRSDPTFVFTLYGCMCASLLCVILGFRTRMMTVIAWVLVEMVYRYSPVFYTGGDTVTRVFLFLGMFANWGQAYSIDSWRRRRKAILGGAKTIPPLRKIAAWPMRLMMLQLCIIYCATGLLKSGGTWSSGTALYYALNLDHFYRFPQSKIVGPAHYLGILPISAISVRWWEVFFPLCAVGVAVNAFEREKKLGIWPKAAPWRRWLGYLLFAAALGCGCYILGLGAHYYIPPDRLTFVPRDKLIVMFAGIGAAVPLLALGLYFGLRRYLPRLFDFVRFWILGKRFWLVFGFGMHIGIDVGMNVGTIAEVMMAVYFAWLSGPEVDGFWKLLMSAPTAMGKHGRPVRPPVKPGRFAVFKRIGRFFTLAVDRLKYRKPGRRYVVHHNPSDKSVRRAALLRVWDLGGRVDFVEDDDVGSEKLALEIEGESEPLRGALAAAALVEVMPGLWWLRPFRLPRSLGRWSPPLRPVVRAGHYITGTIAAMILRQR